MTLILLSIVGLVTTQTLFGDAGAILNCLGSPRYPSEAMTNIVTGPPPRSLAVARQ